MTQYSREQKRLLDYLEKQQKKIKELTDSWKDKGLDLVKYEMHSYLYDRTPCLQTARPFFYYAVKNSIEISAQTHPEVFELIANQIMNEHARYVGRKYEKIKMKAINSQFGLYKYVMEAKTISMGYEAWRKETDRAESYNTFYKMVHRDLIKAAHWVLGMYDIGKSEDSQNKKHNINNLTVEELINKLRDDWDSNLQEFKQIEFFKNYVYEQAMTFPEEQREDFLLLYPESYFLKQL